jgi:hypothetical protein
LHKKPKAAVRAEAFMRTGPREEEEEEEEEEEAAKVEGFVPKATWHWGSDSSVINDPVGEQGRTPLYVGLLSTWASVDGDLMFFPILEEGSFFRDSSRH